MADSFLITSKINGGLRQRGYYQDITCVRVCVLRALLSTLNNLQVRVIASFCDVERYAVVASRSAGIFLFYRESLVVYGIKILRNKTASTKYASILHTYKSCHDSTPSRSVIISRGPWQG